MDFCVAIKGMQNYSVDIERCDVTLLIKRTGSEHLKGTSPGNKGRGGKGRRIGHSFVATAFGIEI